MKNSRVLIIAMLVLGAMILVACGGQAQQATPTEAPAEVAAPTEAPAEEAAPTEAPAMAEGSVAVLLPDSASSARWEADDRRYFEQCFSAAGVEYSIVNAEGDATVQQTQAEAAITNGAKVLLLVNLDSGSGATIIAQAREAGAKVIDYDRLTIEGPGADVYVSFDNVAVGRLMGETLEPVIDGLGLDTPQVVQLNGSPTDNNATLFREGYNSIVQPRVDAGDWALVADQAVPDWDNQQALVIFDQILTAAGGNVDAVFAANDGLAGSVIASLKSQGHDPLPLSGQDATVTGMQYVLSGDQTMSVYKPIKQEADAACAAAIALLNGDDVTSLTPDTLNNGTSDVPFIKLVPTAVTRDNMADTVIADGFRTWEEICVGDFLQYCPEGSIDGAGGMAPMTAAVAGGAAAMAESGGEEMAMDDTCTPATDGPLAGVDPNGVTVTWWHNHTGSREEGLNAMLAEFNETNPCGITVVGESQAGYDEIRDKVNASLTAGELPAALLVGYQNDQAFYQLNQGLADLNTYVNDAHWGLTAEEQADFFPKFFEQSVHPAFDNQRLGFPPNRSMEVLYYNQTWLEELGFDGPPTTPEEFKEQACAAAAANGDGTGGYILRDDASAVASWTYAFGGDILSEDGTGYVLNSQATVDAMTFLKGMLDEGCAYFFTEGFPNPEFAARRALFTQGSSSGMPFYAGDIATVADEAGREPDVWGVTAIPHTTADPVQNIYGGDIMITNNAPEQMLAAWEFIKWFTEPQQMAQWVEISGYFPTRASTEDLLGDFIAESPIGTQFQSALALLPFATYEPQLISYQATRDAMTEAFNAIMQGADVQSTLDQLNEDANALQAELMAEIQ